MTGHDQDLSDADVLEVEVLTLCVARGGAPVRVIHVRGDVDVTTAGRLAGAVDGEIRNRPGPLVLDLTAMTFCGAAGLAVLASGAARAAEHDRRLVVAGLRPRLVVLSTMLWSTPHPDHYPDLGTALDAWGDGHPLLLPA